MVKVLGCYHFKSQTVVPCENEPMALFATSDRLFVATTSRTVEVYSLESPTFPRVHWFNTEALVTCILHNACGDYLATLETKKSLLAEYQFVRVYINWQVDPGKQPMKVRMAGKTPVLSFKDLKSRNAEVIDVPVSGKVNAIVSCKTLSNLLVVVETKIFLYHLVTKQHSNSDQTFQDLDLHFLLNMESVISSVALCGNYLACLTENHVQLLKLSMLNRQKQQKSNLTTDYPIVDNVVCSVESQASSNRDSPSVIKLLKGTKESNSKTSFNSPQDSFLQNSAQFSTVNLRASPNSRSISTDDRQMFLNPSQMEVIGKDENFVEWSFSDDVTASESRNCKIPPKQKVLPKTIFLKELHAPVGGVSPFTVPIQGSPILPKVITRVKEDAEHSDKIKVRVLIQVKQRSTNPFKAIQLIPTYDYNNPVASPRRDNTRETGTVRYHLGGLSCFLEAGYGGVMYSVLPKPQLLSQYKFVSEARKVVCGGSLLHVITSVGVETYTSRSNISAAHNIDNFDNIKKTCPPPDLETCLISIQPFIGIKQVALSASHLYLLNKVESSTAGQKQKSNQTSWSLYALELSTIPDLYKDMVILGTKHQEPSPPTFLHLLLEGLITLKSHLLECNGSDLKTEDLLSECFALLGDYHAHPGCVEWKLALPYYLMSGLKVEDILRQAELHKQITKSSMSSYGQGLMNYLHYVIFDDGPQDNIKPECCDAVLTCFAKSEPQNLSKAILFGKYQNYDAAKALNLLESCLLEAGRRTYKDEGKQYTDMLCLVVLSLKLCEPDKALAVLNQIKQTKIIKICVENPALFHTDFKQFSPLAQLMRQHYSPVFLLILVELFDSNVIPLRTAFDLLTENVYQSEIHKNTHVREYLEAILTDEKRQYIFEEGAAILCDIYIQRLIEWTPPSFRELPFEQITVAKGSGYFGERYSWLDYLPPLYNPKSMKQTCQYLQLQHSPGVRSKVRAQPIRVEKDELNRTGCPCCLCNEDLLKIQAMLCSKFVSEKIIRLVVARLQGNQSNKAYESLWLLAVSYIDFHQCADVVVVKYPKILPQFFLGSIGSDLDKLKYSMESLMCTLSKMASSPSSRDDLYVQTVKDVLIELAGRLTVDQFLSLLPNDGSLLVFIPYIRKCCQTSDIHELRLKITEKGKQL